MASNYIFNNSHIFNGTIITFYMMTIRVSNFI